MASYTYSHTNTSVTFRVTGLTSGDKVVFFVRTEPYDGVMLVDEEHGGLFTASGATMSHSFSVLKAGMGYAINVYVNGTPLGTSYFETGPARPGDWSWSPYLYAGCPLSNLDADLWKQFQAKINEFRAYKGLANYSFTTPRSGVTLLATLFREARTAINDIPGHGTVPTAMEPLDMDYYNALARALNAVS